jgi:hypothetical protein
VGETRDRAAAHPERVRVLAARMDDWIERAGVQLSIDRATGRPIEMPGAACDAYAATR